MLAGGGLRLAELDTSTAKPCASVLARQLPAGGRAPLGGALDRERRGVVAKRAGARLRALNVRHGLKRPPPRRAEATGRVRAAGGTSCDASPVPGQASRSHRPRDGRPSSRAGGAGATAPTLAPRAPGDPRPSLRGVLERLGAAPKIPEDLRHRHVLRHTFATRYYRQTRYLTGLQRWLGQRQSEDDDGLR